MNLNVSNSFGFTCRLLRKQCDSAQTSKRATEDLVDLLKSLNAKEKLLLSKYFCQLPLSVGSFRVLRQLQKLRILTATEYICSIENDEQLQLILIEFLQNENELLINLFISAHYDSVKMLRLNNILENSLRNLFTALAVNPKISDLSYIAPLCKSLPDDVLLNVCIQMHLNCLLELHVAADISLAFKHLSAWINEGVDELIFIKRLADTLLGRHQEQALSHLFKVSTSTSFKYWKFYIILVQSIASGANADTAAFIKKYLKNRLLHAATFRCQLTLLHLLLTARAAAANTMNIQQNLDNYAKWYKQNIGEMSYVLSTEQFKVVLNMLEDSIHYEQEIDYVEIHAAIAISPGGKLVQSYKTKCKTHLARLKLARKQNDIINC
ncbi:uncharacterized protein LOC6579162 [Drosophila mojavensis]|uniref:Fanconi anaemia group A protein N-terminal domain-containing protein n=1 Tax=Drosophila mojavensis TaxID=7230 RepID=B4KNU9_DROMO|nr:uncharacterized protein LOC6579162 [Drosophila mojavensis]EDW08994.1 uncharacterized protein Dmoj_GI19265 [Drosophila mojavensis]